MSDKNKVGRPTIGNLSKGNDVVDALTTIPIAEFEEDDPYAGLTDRQKTIARLKLRGLSQTAMANVLNVSQPVISKEMKRIRAHMQQRGSSIDEEATIGETATLYEEVEYKAWELYHTTQDEGSKLKALSLVLTSREKHTKLLMDLGKLKRAENTTKVEVSVSPFVQKWNEAKKSEVVQTVISATLDELPAPLPPDDIEDAIIIEDDDQN